MKVYSYSTIGNRNEQQDSFYYSEDKGIFIVCDGVGGIAGGAMASQHFCSNFNDFDGNKDEILDNILSIDSKIKELNNDGKEIGSTTFVLSKIRQNNSIEVYNTGDSRAYLFDLEQCIYWKSKDHSFVQDLIDSNLINESNAKNHPSKNIITKAVGLVDYAFDKSDVNFINIDFPPNDCALLLCSDGVWEIIDEDWFMQSIKDNDIRIFIKDFNEILLNNAKDNATYILIIK